MGSGGCEPRIEVTVKMQRKVWGEGVRIVGGCQGGCEPRIEAILKMKKSRGGDRVRVDVNQELWYL